MFLRQSTAVTIQLGPAVDKTDGVTEETALSPTVYVSKAGAAFAARNSASAIAHDRNGWYRVPLDATDTNTLGPLHAFYQDSATHLPVWDKFIVLPANVYDALVVATDKLQTDVAEWGGSAIATPSVAGVPEVDITYVNGVAASPSSAQLGVNVVSVANDALTAAAAASDLAAEIAAGVWDLTDGVESGLTPRQAMRLQSAAAAGKISGAATTTVLVYNAVAASKVRVTATVDADGNRTAITYDLT